MVLLFGETDSYLGIVVNLTTNDTDTRFELLFSNQNQH